VALLAQAQLVSGNTGAALGSFQKLALLQAPSVALQMRIAGLQLTLADPDGALQSVRKALAVQADSLEAQLLLADLLLTQGQTAQALLVARTVQQQHAGLAAGFRLEGDVLMAQNKALPALKLYEQAFGMAKTGPLLLKIHQALTLAGKLQEADVRMGVWLKEHPDDLVARLYFASGKLAAKAYKPAIEEYEKILQQAPTNVAALNDLAWAYQQERDKRALDTAEYAYKLAPGNPTVLDTLGWILLEHGDTARATPLLQKAVGLAPGAEEIRYHLGMGLLKAGDKKGARLEFEQLLSSNKIFPNRAEVQAAMKQL
jgi:putative PEP-CTERM system TPR-repeat lipoprotein